MKNMRDEKQAKELENKRRTWELRRARWAAWKAEQAAKKETR